MRYVAPTAEVRENFHQGRSRRAYEMLGAHPVEQDGREMWHFAVWAPNAREVSLVGEFNEWRIGADPMVKQFDGTWELRVPAERFEASSDPVRYNYPEADAKLKTYKYAVLGADGVWVDKADPYGFAMQNRPNTASRLYDLTGYEWHDGEWMKKRSLLDAPHSPVNIYEMHLGSWKRHEDGTMLSYTEIADQLVPYLTDMGYTHVEFLPVMEHPLDMSWGYQVSGYYAATARYGEPRQLMELIDRLHQAGIGVILDWVPAHFPRDAFGLRRFDGTPCYEHADPRRGDMLQWGTCMFDYARGEVRSFLMSNVCFWLEWYHADGIRCDAVSAMLYHDFGREPGNWLPNKFGGRENLDAIAFMQQMNIQVYQDFPGVMMIAEESTAFPMVTRPVYMGGLGFGFKWNMGWMNDMLSYIKLDPIYRKWHHDKLTFSLFYAFSENFILPFSHDEVVHGKHSMLDKQPGDIWRKFAGLRALYGYTMAHPGKKLLFMGGEFGQFIEWKFDDQLDWFLLLYEKHPEMQKCVRALNRLYKATPALWQIEDSWDGFQWLQANDKDNSLTVFTRTDKKGESIVCMTNFTPQYIPLYRIGLPNGGTLEEIFNSDSEEYAGSGKTNQRSIAIRDEQYGEFEYCADVMVPPLATVYFKYHQIILTPEEKKAREQAKKAAAAKLKAGTAKQPPVRPPQTPESDPPAPPAGTVPSP